MNNRKLLGLVTLKKLLGIMQEKEEFHVHNDDDKSRCYCAWQVVVHCSVVC